ncbi:membrane protein [Luteimicrobium album]|uniref:Membrane protein n=2 Tax=Luteimicrobium album TaxID=1054550 RepID=A0ABQ6I3L2_9MICO|nr:membrane protein [Luteimicrobium album]
MVGGLLGLVVGVLCGLVLPVGLAVLLGWCTVAVSFVVWTWITVWPMDAASTAAHATREEPTRTATHAIVVLAAVASLVGVAFVLLGSNVSSRVWAAAVAVLSVVSSWAAVHTLLALGYARIYFGEPEGGIDFHQTEPPRYSDFAYVAFTVGMSYAISDTDVGSSAIRRLALGHALLSYLFGTVILAALINLVAGL